MFTLDNRIKQKILLVTLSGEIGKEEATVYAEEFKKTTATLNPADYALVLDAREVRPTTPEAAVCLGEMVKDYLVLPFRARFTTAVNPFLLPQAVDDSEMQEKFTFVETAEEALKQLYDVSEQRFLAELASYSDLMKKIKDAEKIK